MNNRLGFCSFAGVMAALAIVFSTSTLASDDKSTCGELASSPKFTDARMRGCEPQSTQHKSVERADIAAAEVKATPGARSTCGTLPYSPKAVDMRMHGCQPQIVERQTDVERADVAALEHSVQASRCGKLPYSPKFTDMRLNDCSPKGSRLSFGTILD